MSGFRLRALLCIVLAVSWPVMLGYAWSAFSTVPSPERLATSRMVRIPTLDTVRWITLRSLAELAIILALVWPARRAWTARLLLAVLGLAIWFLMTPPLSLTTVAWVHRRWLAVVWLLLVLALAITLTLRAARARRTANRNRGAEPGGA